MKKSIQMETYDSTRGKSIHSNLNCHLRNHDKDCSIDQQFITTCPARRGIMARFHHTLVCHFTSKCT